MTLRTMQGCRLTPASPLPPRAALSGPPMGVSTSLAGVAGVTGVVHACDGRRTEFTRVEGGWPHPCYPCHPCWVEPRVGRLEARSALAGRCTNESEVCDA
jgi:hypothetical protein